MATQIITLEVSPKRVNLIRGVGETLGKITSIVLVGSTNAGPAGPGVASGGLTGQVLIKQSSADYETEWVTPVTTRHIHTQSTPSSSWNIQHTLGGNPSVTIVDSAGTAVFGEVSYVSTSNVVISFTNPFSGFAYLT